MAAMSVAPGATTASTLTPPSSSHGHKPGWSLSSSGYRTNSIKDPQLMDDEPTGSLDLQNGYLDYDSHTLEESSSTKGTASFRDQRTSPPVAEGGAEHQPKGTNSVANSTLENLEPGQSASPPEKRRSDVDQPHDDENSKWIHRDKLAKIENEELQAAGIILPKSRSHSRPRRDRSQEKTNGHRRAADGSEQQAFTRSRKNSAYSEKPLDSETPASTWDLRLPEEIAEDPQERQNYVPNGSGKGSRIPVPKISPAPIPSAGRDHLERGIPISRKASGNPLDHESSIPVPQSRSRSGSANALEEPERVQPAKRSTIDISPKKSTTNNTTRKTAPKDKQPAQSRPKTRSGSKNRSASSTRPLTRSGELSPTRAPEGDPPWMVSAYKPDPRLPPDQQLLPTVAKRLQQEKWEQEGKFGNIYDKEFRPLNEEGFLKAPEVEKSKDGEDGDNGDNGDNGEERQDEWPLRADAKSPSLSRPGTGSYSTMPKIQDKHDVSPLPSPRLPQQQTQTQVKTTQTIRVPEPPEEQQEKSKGGCGCCIIM
ncbi:hypothetical protein DL766_007155 [Monosporascus sp. MC13-8B]|uniref:TeaA receptor TeaR n=1 Tax=Monosporascus cannonballus TaxID=155416 RepID=A0ABY0GYH0_9PEZI|nr:hypothetical protein DL762_007666 [Monosporascus cannonballus]RYP00333.1 hypothetical protein DL763_000944 [Monosporascus cannonballus]RYP25062.1 hypothetical protein DL766_007155 [Monosporascus sp. MC13-8B]